MPTLTKKALRGIDGEASVMVRTKPPISRLMTWRDVVRTHADDPAILDEVAKALLDAKRFENDAVVVELLEPLPLVLDAKSLDLVRDLALSVLVREVLCEQIYRWRSHLADPEHLEHINRQLRVRDVPIERVAKHVTLSIVGMPKEELRALASRVLDAIFEEERTDPATKWKVEVER
jgi:hypothetical protein